MRVRSLAWVCVLSLPAAAQQSTVYVLEGELPGLSLGSAAVVVEDLDGDGLRELALGVPGDPARAVRVHSGADGTFLFALAAPQPGVGFGASFDAVGDVDGDGRSELAVAATTGASVHLISLPTGASLWNVTLPVARVRRAGDVDGDGTPDVLALSSGGGSSALRALSGASGQVVLALDFPTEEWRFVDGGGDADGDGHADVLLGNPFWPQGDWPLFQSGRVRVHSGATGALLHDKSGGGIPFDASLGWGVLWLDDLDGDGRSEFAAGKPNTFGVDDPSGARLWSGASGALHADLPSAAGLGAGVFDAGDLDGDGRGDLLVGRAGIGLGLRAYSTATLQPLSAFDLAAAHFDFLDPLAGVLDDLDGDGEAEVFSARADGTALGQAVVLAQCQSYDHYCVGAPNSAWAAGATIFPSGSTSVADNDFTLVAGQLPAGQIGLFLYSAGQAQTPFGNGFLCLGGGSSVMRIQPPLSTGQSSAFLTLDLESPQFSAGPGAITPGSTWNFQFWYRDVPAGGAQFNLSQAMSVPFCP